MTDALAFVAVVSLALYLRRFWRECEELAETLRTIERRYGVRLRP